MEVSGAGCKPRCLQTTSRMSSQPEDGWHGGSGSGDGQAPPARNAAGDAVFPNPTEPIQGAEGVLPATAPTQRTPGAMGPRHKPFGRAGLFGAGLGEAVVVRHHVKLVAALGSEEIA